MSDWWTESKKPIPGKLGKLIDKTIEDVTCYSDESQEEHAKEIIKQLKTNPTLKLLQNEITKLDDFVNGWADSDKYREFDKNGHPISVKCPYFFDVNLTNKDEIVIWTKGYHQAAHDIHQRITKVRLLAHVVNQTNAGGSK